MNTTSEAAESNNATSLSPTTTEPTTPPLLLLSTWSTLSSTVTAALSPPSISATALPPDGHDPQLTIMVVLGLSLLLVGVAAFLAVCRRSSGEGGEEEDEEEGAERRGCGLGGENHSTRSSSEPQLKVWKRLGSYRRTYNMASFRRPQQHRRPPHERECERERQRASQEKSPVARQTLQPEACAAAATEPHVTVPCLFDYVTEI